eukprot:795447-Pelagomonas_calceolata.AAC.1
MGGREASGRAAYRRARHKPGRMADNPPDPHYFDLLASCASSCKVKSTPTKRLHALKKGSLTNKLARVSPKGSQT